MIPHARDYHVTTLRWRPNNNNSRRHLAPHIPDGPSRGLCGQLTRPPHSVRLGNLATAIPRPRPCHRCARIARAILRPLESRAALMARSLAKHGLAQPGPLRHVPLAWTLFDPTTDGGKDALKDK